MTKRTPDKIIKKALAAMANTSCDDSDDDIDDEHQFLMAKDDLDSDNEIFFPLMANSDSNMKDGQSEVNFHD